MDPTNTQGIDTILLPACSLWAYLGILIFPALCLCGLIVFGLPRLRLIRKIRRLWHREGDEVAAQIPESSVRNAYSWLGLWLFLTCLCAVATIRVIIDERYFIGVTLTDDTIQLIYHLGDPVTLQKSDIASISLRKKYKMAQWCIRIAMNNSDVYESIETYSHDKSLRLQTAYEELRKRMVDRDKGK